MIIKENIYSIGVLNPQLRVFDIIMQTEFGTTYNAYLVKGENKTALIETVHINYFDEYLEKISAICDVTAIDYIVLNHTEPDHSGSLARLIELNPSITVVSSMAGNKYVSAICNCKFNGQIVKDGDSIDLGGKTLLFTIAPFLHWPDSMFTYIAEDKVLFPCDFLGAHYCETSMFDNKIHYKDKYYKAFEYYYTCIFGPFKENVLNGLDKIKDFDFDVVCPSHGPILVEGIDSSIAKYRAWSNKVFHKNEIKKVVIAYVSAYGCTTTMAEKMKQGIESVGNFDVEMINILDFENAIINEKIEHSDAVLFGSPTINRDALKPVWDIIAGIDAITNKGKLCGVFGSYGWSGEAVKVLEERLRGLKMNVFGEGVRANFVPSNEELEKVTAYAVEFAKMI